MKSKPLHILFVGMLPSQITQLNTVLLKGGFAVTSSSLPDAQHLTDVQLSASDVLLIDSLRSHPEIVAQIQAELSAQNLDIPILVYSSLGDEAAIVAALKAGAKDFISSKNPQRILSSVQRELDCVHKRAQLAEQARADQLLHDIEGWMLQGLDYEPLAQKICLAVMATFGVRGTWIGGKQADGSVRVVAASEHAEMLRELGLRWDESPHGAWSVGLAIQTQQAVMLTADSQTSDLWHTVSARFGMASVLALPLLARGEMIGVLVLYAVQRNYFSEQLIRRYEQFSNRLAVILLMAQEQQKLRLLSAAMSYATQAIFITQHDGSIIWCNRALMHLSGYSEQEILHSTPHLFSAGNYDPALWQNMWQQILHGKEWSGDVLNLNKSGETYHVWQSITPLYDQQGSVNNFLCVQQDVTEKKALEQKIEYLAYHDALTGLPNRLLFNDRMRQMLNQAKREHLQFALLFVDLDGFKAVNDNQGHAAGDELLKLVAKRLGSCVREADTVARLGGDEFVILLRDASDKLGLKLIAQKIIESLAAPYNLSVGSANISASMGISRYPSDALAPERLMSCADEAMYQAKHIGKNCYVFWQTKEVLGDSFDWQI